MVNEVIETNMIDIIDTRVSKYNTFAYKNIKN